MCVCGVCVYLSVRAIKHCECEPQRGRGREEEKKKRQRSVDAIKLMIIDFSVERAHNSIGDCRFLFRLTDLLHDE